jgi:hypothetical protein
MSEPGSDDIVELAGRRFPLPRWRPSRGAGVLAVAALIVGLAAGYAVGDRHARGTPAVAKHATASVSPVSVPAAAFSFAVSPPVTQDTGACSAQTGRELQLGVQITNQSAAPLTLKTARAVLPMGGLKQVSQHWGPCGALPDGLIQAIDILPPGNSTWLTVTFNVQLRCPAPAPVQFTVGYLAQGHPGTATLPGFPDLSQVPYSGCPANTAGVFVAQAQVPAESP